MTLLELVFRSTEFTVLVWDPTDIVHLFPALHRMFDSLLSNYLVNKLFVMIEETQQNGIPVHTCNMEVQQLMTEPLVETFLRCKYDQLYLGILSSEVTQCPVLHGDHWCLVAIFLKEKDGLPGLFIPWCQSFKSI